MCGYQSSSAVPLNIHTYLVLHLFAIAGAPGSARAAILNFLAAAEPAELRPLLELFLTPLSSAFVRPAGEEGQAMLAQLVAQDDPDAHRLIEGPWWGRCLGRQPGSWWLAHINATELNAEPLRRRIGYLNTLEDLLKHLGHCMQASCSDRILACFG